MSTETAIIFFSHIQSLFELLPQAKKCDAGRLKNRLLNLKKTITKSVDKKSQSELAEHPLSEKQLKSVEQLQQAIVKSIQDKQRKLNSLPTINYPDGLPISDNAKQIAEAIRANQVVIIAGETGSGKTTQIPKICLELGRGVDGLIGHTQPRRIAARTVANRIA